MALWVKCCRCASVGLCLCCSCVVTGSHVSTVIRPERASVVTSRHKIVTNRPTTRIRLNTCSTITNTLDNLICQWNLTYFTVFLSCFLVFLVFLVFLFLSLDIYFHRLIRLQTPILAGGVRILSQ